MMANPPIRLHSPITYGVTKCRKKSIRKPLIRNCRANEKIPPGDELLCLHALLNPPPPPPPPPPQGHKPSNATTPSDTPVERGCPTFTAAAFFSDSGAKISRRRPGQRRPFPGRLPSATSKQFSQTDFGGRRSPAGCAAANGGLDGVDQRGKRDGQRAPPSPPPPVKR